MISGEGLTIAVKHKAARPIDQWKPPVAFAGNEVRSSGQVARSPELQCYGCQDSVCIHANIQAKPE